MERGYVLHSRPYRETSVIANLLVDGLGRVDAVVRVGSGKRNLKSIIQPFQPLIFSLTGRSELKTMTLVEPMSPAIPLTGKSLYAGIYLNELMIRTLQHGGETLFICYHKALMALAREFGEAQLRYVEMALLKELGAMPSLEHDGHGKEIEATLNYQYLVEQGFWPIADGAGKIRIWSGAGLQRFAQGSLIEEDLPAAKGLMRILLQPLLGEKPLLSRALFAANHSSVNSNLS
ncbi:DNA repair protein RecO [Shewanella corallii]|uniref:DNA repair protein RecO n=1 Tax=Shewanella corallii TaxID=560080 RepID=A0ABT0N4L5_9GAMM|nr:DNA repair protein RecO [Shewanella corallii]MCL2913401.1 DNA repair protein RecO [Shewanella corallii]